MKILIITPGGAPCPAVKGGAVEYLVTELIKYNERYKKHSIVVYSIYDECALKKSKEYKNCEVRFIKIDLRWKKVSYYISRAVSIAFNKYIASSYIKRINRSLSKEYFDVVIIENSFQFIEVLPSEYSGKCILHLHNDYINKKEKLGIKYINQYNKVFTVSKFIASRVNEVRKTNPAICIYNGIDNKLFSKVDNAFVKKLRYDLNIKNDDIVIVFAGRLQPEKGIKELIEAFININNSNTKLLVIGSSFFAYNNRTKYIKNLEGLVGKRKNIIFTGYIQHEQLPAYYSLGSIGVVPSIFEEPFGLTVVEQMSMGLPVITTNRGGIPELIDNDCGIIVEYDESFKNRLQEKIQYLVDNPIVREKLGEKAKLRAKQFSTEIFCSKFYEEVEKE